jgi:hypothetical protein
MRVTNGIPLGCPLLFTVVTMNPIKTQKVRAVVDQLHAAGVRVFWYGALPRVAPPPSP